MNDESLELKLYPPELKLRMFHQNVVGDITELAYVKQTKCICVEKAIFQALWCLKPSEYKVMSLPCLIITADVIWNQWLLMYDVFEDEDEDEDEEKRINISSVFA